MAHYRGVGLASLGRRMFVPSMVSHQNTLVPLLLRPEGARHDE